MDQPLGAPLSPVYGKFYAFDGDLHRDQGVTVEMPDTLYQLSNAQVLVPTVARILQSFQQDATLQHFGPHANGDANTELVRMRKMIPLPFEYVSIFLARAMTPRDYFETVYQQMVVDQVDQACRALTKYFQLAITRQAVGQPSPLEHQLLTGTPRNDSLLSARDQIIEHHFPQVKQNLVGVQQNQIATQLANLHATQLQHRQEDEQRRQEDKNSTVEK